MSPYVQSFVMHIGEMGSRWGLNRTLGQMCGLLYVSPEAMNADEIAETLNISRSNVSMGLKELKTWRPCSRNALTYKELKRTHRPCRDSLHLRHPAVSRNSITTESADAQCVGRPELGPISDRAGGFRTVRPRQ